jgi:hypothetical protein
MSHLAIITPLTDKLKATNLWSLGFKDNKLGYYKGVACFVQDSEAGAYEVTRRRYQRGIRIGYPCGLHSKDVYDEQAHLMSCSSLGKKRV